MFRDLKLALFLTGKYIRRGNLGTLLMTMLIMSLCFINLVFMPALFNGVITTTNSQSVDFSYANLIIEPEEGETYVEGVREIESIIKNVPGVNGSSAHLISGTVFEYDENNDGKDIESGVWSVKSIKVGDEKATVKIHENMVEGEYLEDGDRDKIIIGKEISGTYEPLLESTSLHGVKVGDTLKLTFGNGINREYEVKGIFGTKSPMVDIMAFITKDEMESVIGVNNMASEIIVSIDNPGEEEKYIEEFRKIGIDDEEIKTWKDYMGMLEMMNQSFEMIQLILTGIGLVVAAVTIFIVIYVSVVSKKRQIGILKAIGMKDRVIIASFVFHAIFYAIVGIVLGIIFSYSLLEPFFVRHPLEFPNGGVSLVIRNSDILFSFIALLFASLVGGYIPARRGAKESILEAMWG